MVNTQHGQVDFGVGRRRRSPIIRILDRKRTEVMESEQAGYFIHQRQELGNQVSRMIVKDPRYQALKASQTARNHNRDYRVAD